MIICAWLGGLLTLHLGGSLSSLCSLGSAQREGGIRSESYEKRVKAVKMSETSANTIAAYASSRAFGAPLHASGRPQIPAFRSRPVFTAKEPRKNLATSYLDSILSLRSLRRSSGFSVRTHSRRGLSPNFMHAASELPRGRELKGSELPSGSVLHSRLRLESQSSSPESTNGSGRLSSLRAIWVS